MKIETEVDVDREQVILNLLFMLGNESLYTIEDYDIEMAIREYLNDEYTFIENIIIAPSEIKAVKEEFIKYLNNLIKQLS